MAWARHNRLTHDEASFLDLCLSGMDQVFLEHWRAQQGKPAAQTIEDKLARWEKAT